MLGSDFPTGTGIKIEAGSKIVIQMHYNLQNITGGAQNMRDQTGDVVHVDKLEFVFQIITA